MIKDATDNILRIRSCVIQCMISHWFEKAITFRYTFLHTVTLSDQQLMPYLELKHYIIPYMFHKILY